MIFTKCKKIFFQDFKNSFRSQVILIYFVLHTGVTILSSHRINSLNSSIVKTPHDCKFTYQNVLNFNKNFEYLTGMQKQLWEVKLLSDEKLLLILTK